jgi:hypothetical protein
MQFGPNEALWQSTLLLVVFDEHGGFYDHVVPPAAIPPDDAQPSEYTFKQFGVRVPAILVSPWVQAGVVHTQFDHTSLLKYLIEKWDLGELGRRTAAANSVGSVISQSPRQSPLKWMELSADQLAPPDPTTEAEAFGSTSSHQAALAKLGQWLQADGLPIALRVLIPLLRLASCIQRWVKRLILGTRAFSVSLAQPDKLAPKRQTRTADHVVNFMMRMKKYAAIGLHNRLLDESLPEDQKDHSVQTLAGIVGVHLSGADPTEKVGTAKTWLAEEGNLPPGTPVK